MATVRPNLNRHAQPHSAVAKRQSCASRLGIIQRLAGLFILIGLVACASAEPTPTPAPPTETPATVAPTPTPFPATAPSEPTAIPTDTAPVQSITGTQFDGDRAMEYLIAQTDLGPRYPGSEGHLQVRELIIDELEALGFTVEQLTFEYQGLEGMNIVGRGNIGVGPPIILGAHYDTRARSDQSPDQRDVPTLGAVDGGSGVAVLLELGRTLNLDQIDNEIWLTFFDFEDNGTGGIDGWDWIVGSTDMAANLTEFPESMILVDMIGDADQQLYYDGASNVELREEIWSIAIDLGYREWFIPRVKYTMLDDHVPFIRRGIPAIDIIDFDYDYWHTVEDTPDKASAESLERVGHVIQYWLEIAKE